MIVMNMEDWEKSYEDFYIKPKKDETTYLNPRPEEEIADDILREVVGDYLNDSKKKQLLDE
tara:strand:- start:416 stop:598 length:183 start_codon:yes stop_codon:yes gene_type:complete